VEFAKKNGIAALYLSVDQRNLAAISLFEKLGYKIVKKVICKNMIGEHYTAYVMLLSL
jgi:ribosomal protein S18 acetylase RimI-like enzyme